MKSRPLEAWGVVGILWFVSIHNDLDGMTITVMRVQFLESAKPVPLRQLSL
jgi:hypothetical protein